MKQFWQVFSFEYMGYIKSKIFLILTILFCAGIGATLTVPPLLKDGVPQKPGDEGKILFSDYAGVLPETLDDFQAALPGYELVREERTEADIRKALSEESFDGALLITEDGEARYLQKRDMFGSISGAVSAVYAEVYRQHQMHTLGLTERQITELNTPPVFELIETDKGAMDTYFYTYALLMLLYISVVMYGQLVATSVATEKSSRAMELLITSAKPNNLLFGKILGSGLAGLTQLGLILLSALGFYQFNQDHWADNEIIRSFFDMPVDIVLYAVLFYVLGFFCYAALLAAMASMVSRVEDVSMISTPVTVLLVIGFFLSIAGLTGDPNSLLLQVTSFIPFFTPMVMFVRICVSTVPVYEIIISIVLLFATVILTAYFAARVYRLGTLIYGKAPNLKTIFSSLRAERQAR